MLKVIPLPTMIPDLAVMIPTESILVTSSYVKVPAIPTSPENVATPLTERLVAVTTPTSSPTNFDAVIIPALAFWNAISSVLLSATFPVLP